MWFRIENWLFLRMVWFVHRLSNWTATWGERLDKTENEILREDAYRKE